jgi:RHS repeat-associated protein
MRSTSLQYFYHPDHLGSASWITDADGNGYQHLQYLPPDSYRDGESWVEQRLGSYNTPYQFSGKEKDEETGYNYFGARYYDSELSVWLSVDPMSDKHPELGTFTYTSNNPVILVDPDGRDWFMNETNGKIYYNSEMKKGQEGTGAMTGDGWVHMGKNGMFDKPETYGNEDVSLVLKASDSKLGYDPKTNTISAEANFSVEESKEMMDKLGFSLDPTQQTIYESSATNSIPQGGGKKLEVKSGTRIEITEKWAYMPKDFVAYRTSAISNTLSDPKTLPFSVTSVARYQLSYTNNKALIFIIKSLEISQPLTGHHDYTSSRSYDSWAQFNRSTDSRNILINKFRKLNGTG